MEKGWFSEICTWVSMCTLSYPYIYIYIYIYIVYKKYFAGLKALQAVWWKYENKFENAGKSVIDLPSILWSIKLFTAIRKSFNLNIVIS